jgi:hypothetical protein
MKRPAFPSSFVGNDGPNRFAYTAIILSVMGWSGQVLVIPHNAWRLRARLGEFEEMTAEHSLPRA